MKAGRLYCQMVSLVASVVLCVPFQTHASMLTFVRDTISTSAPGFTATHTVEFTLAHAVPASGHIIITPQDAVFSIPIELGVSDVVFSVSTGGPYVSRTLAALPSAAEDGVQIVSGTSGSLIITLSSASGISAGARIRIAVGSDTAQIRNPVDIDSYRIMFNTTDASAQPLDNGTTMIAVVAQVAVTSLPTSLPPSRLDGLPSGTIEANNHSVELSLSTDKPATCRYATTANVSYDAMTEQFSNPTTFIFTTVVTDIQNNTTYSYYVRCRDLGGNTNDDDYVISFSVKVAPTTNTSLAGAGSGGNGGVGDFPGGSAVLFLSNVTLIGWTSPQSSVRVLKDGVLVNTTLSKADGSFRAELKGLERGLYTLVLSAKDPLQNQSASVSTTLTLGSGTNNTITDLVVPPTLKLEKDTIGVGESARITGYSVPGARIELSVRPQAGGAARIYVATTTPQGVEGSGTWTLSVPGRELEKGTYSLRARVVVTAQRTSDFSGITRLGVGEAVSAPLAAGGIVGDLNGDGKVNLIDFSILLTNWGKAGIGDLNDDAVVNLADFSILLFNWTG